ncbi:MAG: class II aldolase/adducin family protein [Chloroflexi bacterium]|nr:class II aldolase/adducin family protein [Chloroflexota bacterium]
MPDLWEPQRRAVLEAAQELARQGLVIGASGNVSLRLEPQEGKDLLAITPTQRAYSTMRPEDIVVVDFDGEPVAGELPPSSELLLHVGVYRARRDVGAVIHTHSTYASVCAVAGLEIPPIIDEVVLRVGGPIAVALYAFPGTQELAERACHALGERNAVLLRNHGAVGVGKDLREALEVCQLVERAAKVFVMASLLGRATPLTPEMVELEQQLFQMRRRAEEANR